jgi:hypothetical protein
MSEITEREKNKIRLNYEAFVSNFGKPRIEKGSNGVYFVYYPEWAEEYIQYCWSIDYLAGWLYGCVQGVRIIQHEKLNNEKE